MQFVPHRKHIPAPLPTVTTGPIASNVMTISEVYLGMPIEANGDGLISVFILIPS
jgi:hypothetical protein